MSAGVLLEGFYADIDEVTYHADRDSLSVSGAKVILKAPALFKWQQDHPVYKDIFDVGSAAHQRALGAGPDIVVVQVTAKDGTKSEAENFMTNSAKAHRDEIRAAGAIPVLASTLATVDAMAAELKNHQLAMRLLAEGAPEVSAYAIDEPTGVLRRCRFDYLTDVLGVDYKSAVSAEPAAFVRAAVNYGYHQQHAWYKDLAADLGHPAKAFAFVVQEKEPPYLVTVVELPVELVDIGRRRNRRALERFRDCIETDRWPGYLPDDQYAQPPAPRWALYEEDIA